MVFDLTSVGIGILIGFIGYPILRKLLNKLNDSI
jgi:glycopeptide antibiotics resistance protein